ncbi:Rqc2 family fibronectin-binding protein [Alkalibacterium olivapovliticus]|uniref:Rqc2 homolog RqcH n=1 Tax=Alkalibacterium olivapovliticus TaxID=99907 RepID=A0A2T0W9C5_9LACT|nr:NFACT RNA binding domain-containing protein [Alkalibacterium olivapovliticus]PRY83310.1 putative ribosome quality control (RQC) complex YloA/Tae2 family protein [Alkalibacterium olivapovliticus]
MSFDGLFVHSLTQELKDQCEGGRLSKIQQPFENEIIIKIRANRKNVSLLLSAHPQYARAQLTTIPFDNPATPPHFCMILRKYLEGAIIESIEQKENDRQLVFTFKSRNELGDTEILSLVVEIMGRHSNILLINTSTNKLIDAIRHVPSSQNTYRTLLPGAQYVEAPDQERDNPFTYDGDFPIKELSTSEKVKWIQTTFQGFGKESATELVYRFEQDSAESYKALFQQFVLSYDLDKINPTLTRDGHKEFFTPFDFTHIKGEKFTFETLSELMDRYFQDKAERDRVHQQANDLTQLVKNYHQKNEKKLIKLNKELKDTEKADSIRIKGEVLTAYLHEVNKGDEKIELPNFYEEDAPLTIELNPQKTPAENAQRYFSRYQKLKSAKKHLTKQIRSTQAETDYFDTLLTQISIASLTDIEDIRQELRDGHYLKKKKATKKKKQTKSKPEAFTSSDGTSILVGKNNTQNDELTLKKARKSHYWAHAKDIPGSHVIIEDDEPSQQTIEEACLLAAYYSKYRLSSSVPVDVVQVKQIKKPNGAKPGYVIYEGQTTYFVTPSDDAVRALKSTNAN